MKSALRSALRVQRNQVSKDDHHAFSEVICSQLIDTLDQLGTHVGVYIPMESEVDIDTFIQALFDRHCYVFCPRCKRNGEYEMVQFYSMADLAPGTHGILEPGPHCPGLSRHSTQTVISGWVIPGLAFDLLGHRLGYGKGIYDRLLEGTRGYKIGVCFEFQYLDRPLPVHAHDIPMDLILTNAGSFSVRNLSD